MQLSSTQQSTQNEQPARKPSTPTRPAPPSLYRTKDVVELLGISRRQLQYWSQTDLVVPSEKTPGGHHRYTFEDLVALKAAKRLIDAGVSVQRIRTSIQALRSMLPNVRRPLSALTLVATGDVVLVLHNGAAFEAVSGQEWVFEVARFERELADWRAGPKPNEKSTTEARPNSQRAQRA